MDDLKTGMDSTARVFNAQPAGRSIPASGKRLVAYLAAESGREILDIDIAGGAGGRKRRSVNRNGCH